MSYKNSLTKIGIYSSEDILSSSQVMRLIPNLNSIIPAFLDLNKPRPKLSHQNTLITMYSLLFKYE